MRQVAAFPLILWLLSSLGWSQQPRPSGDSASSNEFYELEVRTEGEHGQPFTIPLRVQLFNQMSVSVMQGYTRDGRLEFRGMPAGTYRVKVTGADIEDTTSENTAIGRYNNHQVLAVRVKMLQSERSTQGSVSTYELNVPRKAKREMDKGSADMKDNNFVKAISHFEKAILLYPQYAAAYNSLGVACMKTGDVPRARTAFQKAVDTNDQSGMAFVNLGRLFLLDRNYKEAETVLQRALSLNPLNAEALMLLSQSQLLSGNLQDVVLSVKKLHELPHGKLAIGHVFAGMALEQLHQPTDAIAQYQLFLGEDPRDRRADDIRQHLASISSQAPISSVGRQELPLPKK